MVAPLTRTESASRLPQPISEDQLTVGRMIILVPAQNTNMPALARRVWTLAQPCSIPVLYLSLASREPETENNQRLRMIMLASMTRDDQVVVDTHLHSEGDWIKALQGAIRPGDIVICLAEHAVRVQHRGDYALSDVIETMLDIPVYVIHGVMINQHVHKPTSTLAPPSLSRLTRAWARLIKFGSRLALPALMMGALVILQVRISFSAPSALRTLLLSMTGLAEVGVFGIWSVSHR